MKLRVKPALVGRILVVLVLASRGLVEANELNLTVCRDALYRPGASDSMVQPVAVLVGPGLRLGTSGTLNLRAGYSGYANLARSITAATTQITFNSARLQLTPVFRVTTPIKDASAFGGVGLAARFARLRREVRAAANPHYLRDVSTYGLDQTFLAGLSYEASRKIGVDLTVERVGFSLTYDAERSYRDGDLGNDTLQLTGGQNILDVGWRAAAPTGIGIGLRLKL